MYGIVILWVFLIILTFRGNLTIPDQANRLPLKIDYKLNYSEMGTINWKSAVWAGIIAGLIFMMLEMLMVPLFLGGSPWGPPRMIGAIVLGKEVLPPPAVFEFGIFIAALILHLVLSVIYAAITAFVVNTMELGKAIAAGAVIGLVIYLINFYVMTSVFPWFANARNWVSIFAHISFGIAAAWAYIKLRVQRSTSTSTT